ncbi:MAG: hypothetical protein ACPGRD_11585, partial [Planktomarina sp.]
MIKQILLNAACAALLTSTAAMADTWTIDRDASVIGFGSVKSDSIGEAHTLRSIAGSVAADGTVSVELDLTSIQTNIEVRNERIGEYVLAKTPTAMLNATVDMAAMESLEVGEHMIA